MNTPDEFSLYHDDLLEGDYDYVDWIASYFPLGQTWVCAPGGDNCEATTLR
jgi:hypothetical protein